MCLSGARKKCHKIPNNVADVNMMKSEVVSSLEIIDKELLTDAVSIAALFLMSAI